MYPAHIHPPVGKGVSEKGKNREVRTTLRTAVKVK